MSTSRWGERLVRYPADLADRYRQAGLWGTRTIADEFHAIAAGTTWAITHALLRLAARPRNAHHAVQVCVIGHDLGINESSSALPTMRYGASMSPKPWARG